METPYEARQLVDWIGQAKLVCYAKKDIDKLRSVGIRSIFDFKKGNKSRVALREISDSIGITSPLLEVIAEQIYDVLGSEPIYVELEPDHIYDLLNTGPTEEVPDLEFKTVFIAYETPLADQEYTGERSDFARFSAETHYRAEPFLQVLGDECHHQVEQ